MNYLLITPPLTQLNTPYPATTVLKGFLEVNGQEAHQADLGIELVDAIYTPQYLEKIFDIASTKLMDLPTGIAEMVSRRHQYCSTVKAALSFLRGTDNTLAPRIANRTLLPEGPRFHQLADMEWAFGTSGTDDKARYLATMYIEDLADLIREAVDSRFDLIRYAEHLASYAPTFDELNQELQQPATMIDEAMLSLLDSKIEQYHPHIVAFSVPFPGCLYAALRCCQHIRSHHPHILTNIGGGFPNTEWRQLSDIRIFDYTHSFTLDDGELPMWLLGQYVDGLIPKSQLLRTYYAHTLQGEGPDVRLPQADDFCQRQHPDEAHSHLAFNTTPSFDELPLHLYISLSEMTNPMHRLWSNGRWNKLMMAHGCYWARCAFCDTSLDYIGRYQAPTATQVVDRMEQIARQTGNRGFHFVDEALPPKLLREVADEIIRRRCTFTFWGNIRFEKAYTPDLCYRLAQAGCIAVSGGLEVASDRLLQLMNKGVTIQQTIEACRNFKQAGIMVHTYLMYGFPTETLQETFNALEVVRSMFAEGIVQSAFWHRYAMTCHSPSGLNPERYGVQRTTAQPHPFCNNEVDFIPIGAQPQSNLFPYDIDAVGEGLRFATFNYMNEVGLDMPIRSWFHLPPSPNDEHKGTKNKKKSHHTSPHGKHKR